MNSTLLAIATDRSDAMVVMQKLASTANAATKPTRSVQCMLLPSVMHAKADVRQRSGCVHSTRPAISRPCVGYFLDASLLVGRLGPLWKDSHRRECAGRCSSRHRGRVDDDQKRYRENCVGERDQRVVILDPDFRTIVSDIFCGSH